MALSYARTFTGLCKCFGCCSQEHFPWCTWPGVTDPGPGSPWKIWKLKLRFFWGRVYYILIIGTPLHVGRRWARLLLQNKPPKCLFPSKPKGQSYYSRVKQLMLTAEWGHFWPQRPRDLICSAKNMPKDLVHFWLGYKDAWRPAKYFTWRGES